jgi:hypothetical protein
MENETGNEVIEIEDSFLASAFLLETDIIKEVKPFLKSERPPRVAFLIKGDIREAVARIQANEKRGVMDIIRAAKQLRNSIFLLKATASPGKRG